jgi:membrane fusion protein (multidrug efflux system)
MPEENNLTSSAKMRVNRKRWLTIVVLAFVVIGIGYGAYWAMFLRELQTTDDAYVNGNIVQITQISGIGRHRCR